MKNKKLPEISSTNLYTNIVDIQNSAIITRDNLAISVYELSPVNADLLTAAEQTEFVSNLTGCLAAIRVPYKILAVPRPFDIQPYLDELEEQRRTADDDVSKHIIAEEIAELSGMVASGSIVEKFFYLIVWDNAEDDYTKSRNEVVKCWEDGKITAQLLERAGLLQLINLIFNPSTEITDDVELEAFLPQIG